MRRGFKPKEEVLALLKDKYDEIVSKVYNGNYLDAVQNFDELAENKLRATLQLFYNKPRSRDQAWRTCKGSLYEYAVFKVLNQKLTEDPVLNRKFMAVMGDEALFRYKEQVAIKNWSEILPDADILIVEKSFVKAIISCKTSLRERLTETAFWKRELEKSYNTKHIKLVFVTTDKDDELRIDANRYILLHVIDCTFVTHPQKYKQLIEVYKEKYGNKQDFTRLISKVKSITDIKDFLYTL